MMRLYRCLYIVLFYLSLIDVVVLLPPLSVSGQQPGRELFTPAAAAAYEGRVVKGSKNAIYLVKSSKKCIFPDFNTFVKMGYSLDNVTRLPDSLLDGFERGDTLPSIAMFRADDFSFHAQCDDAHRMVHDLGLVANMGNLMTFLPVLRRVKARKALDLLVLGGSITAGGYYAEFVRQLESLDGLSVTVHNHGHGATEINYSLFCVDIDRYEPDLVLIDFSVNDYGHPKLMDALIRKLLVIPSRPVVSLVDLWTGGKALCDPPRYLLHSYYYQIPLINVCPAVTVCFGRGHMPKSVYEEYSLTDGIHPWGSKGVLFLGGLLYAWWTKLDRTAHQDTTLEFDGKLTVHAHSYDHLASSSSLQRNQSTHNELLAQLPPPLYVADPIGLCTRCDALADDADAKLTPVKPPVGFRKVVRVKIGYGGFTADKTKATKSFRKSWEADRVGAEISFRFFGSTVKIAIWQRRDGMGVLHAFVDGNEDRIAKASGFFKGYTWAMERNNTGRSEILTLFEGLPDTEHVLTLRVSPEPANVWVKGHLVQVFALLSASNNMDCKSSNWMHNGTRS